MEDKYSVLIRFGDQSSTDTFYKHFNGRHFSSLEVCFARSGCFYFPLIIKIISKYFSSLLSVYIFPFLLNVGGGLSCPFHG